jgi:hypothetical protein
MRVIIALSAILTAERAMVFWQDAEKVRQRRSRFAQKLNVPERKPRIFACCGLAGRPF